MNFDLKNVPFSYAGSYLSFNHYSKELHNRHTLCLRTVRGGLDIGLDRRQREIFFLEPVIGKKPVTYTVAASPEKLRLERGGGWVEICFENKNIVRFRGAGVSLRLVSSKSLAYTMPAGKRWMINHYSSRTMLMLTPLQGAVEVDAPWQGENAEFINITTAGKIWEFALESFQAAWEPQSYDRPFAACVAKVSDEFAEWRGSDHELSAYIHWASMVAPEGCLRRPGFLSSKNWMVNVWSWDSCFHALALAQRQPELAWDQLMNFFDQQNPTGALPDLVNDMGCLWNFSKPPIQGWTIQWLMQHSSVVTRDRLAEIYEPLCKWTEWWFKYRDDDQDGIPQYNHGNDSGWDNATAFALGLPIEGPDLTTYLILQMFTLAEIALRLKKKSAAAAWDQRAEKLLKKFIKHSWRRDHFVATRSGTHEVASAGDCLLGSLPILLGKRLPKSMREKLVAGIARFLTPHGLATEHPNSKLFQADGYWRGPIWAPPTLLIVEGLRSCGEFKLADTIAARFCRTCENSGFAENFNALTGEALRDKSLVWTASVYQVLSQAHSDK